MSTDAGLWPHAANERRASFDQYGDGTEPESLSGGPKLWPDFKVWALDNLGQGYSLAASEGSLLDPVTRWAFRAYCAGRRAVR